MTCDIRIKGGSIVDGTGRPAYTGDVAIQGGRIAALGPGLDRGARRVIDASGLAVSPGFVDLHTHYDAQLLWDPLATSSCWHGVTTVLIGNCGFSLAPCRSAPSDREYLMGMLARVEGINIGSLRLALDWSWETVPQYLDRVGRCLGVNVMALVGHSAVRYWAMGADSYEREATPGEVERMKAAVREAIAAGAWGFSTSRLMHDLAMNGKPVPSRLAGDDEVFELACVLREFGRGIFAINPKSDGVSFTDENKPFLKRISRATGRPVVWNALFQKPERPLAWRDLLNFMEEATWEGAQVFAMGRCQTVEFEFTFAYTILFQLFPKLGPILERPDLAERQRLLADPALRPALRNEFDEIVRARFPRRSLHTVMVRKVALDKNRPLQGRWLREIAAQQGKHPLDAMLDLAVEEDLKTEFAYVGVLNADEGAVAEIIRHPNSIVGVSDAGAHLEFDPGTDYSTLLLSRWVRDKKALGLEEAVRRLTFMPATVMGLTDRGRLAEGMTADVLVFDPATVAPAAREKVWDLPGGNVRMVHRAQGMRHVIVNGQVLLENGRHTGAFPGRVLRSGDYPAV